MKSLLYVIMTPPPTDPAVLLEKVLFLMEKEESLYVIMTPPPTSAVLLEKVLLLMVKEEY